MFELETSPLDTLGKGGWTVDEVALNLLELLVVLSRALESGLNKVGLREVEVDSLRRVDVEGVKGLACPLMLAGKTQGLTWMVCSIALGKFFTVHEGIDFSGGSWDDEYDSVIKGMTTWVLALVPRVPDSRRGFW